MIDKIRNRIKKIYLTNPNRYNAQFLDMNETNNDIRGAIQNKTPFFASRLGSVELSALNIYYKKKEWPNSIKQQMSNNAGFFPTDNKNLMKFCNLYINEIPCIDLLGVWYNEGESELFNQYNSRGVITELKNLEPYYSSNPWSAALKGKNVLIIHPFAETIRDQYKNRQYIFDNKNILPEFNLITLKSVQTISNNKTGFEDWFSALKYMKDQIKDINFDVAIIGAGAYGLPLGAYIKELNKVAIHLGGSTQILFGIKGSRWDNHPIISGFYNQYWCRPYESERPEGFKNVEKGCYW
ncbi:hypothetical protein [Metabacillus idriensis]|uniref:hypothetical protein n=1 Tax=Metabacillus idriensis TaxID=324768 RepID=UPI003D2D1827